MTTCSGESERLGEQLAGTAPEAVAWVALEQNGPWGAKAFTASHLDPGIGREIETRASAYGVRPSLIRSPGRHADEHHGGARRLLVGFTVPGRTWLAEGTLTDPAETVDLDWAGLAAGRVPDGLERTDRAHLLVCTNGTRDVCCASRGRPVALGAATRWPGQVWEATHTSGHRFAPTAVLLPFGTLHGRLSAESAAALVEAGTAGRTVLEGSRGRSTYAGRAQVAELAVRERLGELDLDALTVQGSDDLWRVHHRDGRAWQVRTAVVPTGVERSESCGKALAGMSQITVDIAEDPAP